MNKKDTNKENEISKPHTHQQKLEMLGSLVSGITHEINTPMHYLENNLTFLKHAFRDLLALDQKYQQLLAQVKSGNSPSSSDWQILEDAEAKAEPDFDNIRNDKRFKKLVSGTSGLLPKDYRPK